MRLFLTLCSLAVVAHAKPQYNYGTGISGAIVGGGGAGFISNGGGGGGGGGGSTLIGGGNGAAGFISAAGSSQQNAYSSNGNSNNGYGGGGGSALIGVGGGNAGFISAAGSSQQNAYSSNGNSNYGNGIIGSGDYSQRPDDFSTLSSSQQFSSSNQQNFLGNQQRTNQGNSGFGAPIVHKQIFKFTAPEDHERLQQSKRLLIGRPQTNYRVVFIRAPSSSSANVKLSAEYAPKEEKTIIYVLTKKDSELEVNDIATPAPIQPSKPEVHFIKYKTEQEADFAQSKITAEYDKIQGTSENIDAGVAQERSVIGILGSNNADLSQVSTSTTDESETEGSGSSTNENKVYLPPSNLRV